MTVVRDVVKAGGQDTRWHDTDQPPISWHTCCGWVSVYSTAASVLAGAIAHSTHHASQHRAVCNSAHCSCLQVCLQSSRIPGPPAVQPAAGAVLSLEVWACNEVLWSTA